MRQHRIDGSEGVDPASIASHIAAGERVIVQYSKGPYSTQELTLLNRLAKTHGRQLEIRFYGHYFETFDASVLRLIPDARSVSIDCLTNASNLEALSEVRNLVELSLGVFELENADVLSYCDPRSLKVLSLGDTRKANIDLRPLSEFLSLERFHTSGHTKNISTICRLPLLLELTLSSIKRNDDIQFVSDIPTLKSLRILLGGRTSIAHILSTRLESLEIIRVQGLEDLGDLSRFENLERLLVEDQLRLSQVKVGRNAKLKDLRIINCKNLKTIEGVEDLKMLSSLRIYKTSVDYEEFVARMAPGSLKTLSFFTGKTKRDNEIRNDLERRRS